MVTKTKPDPVPAPEIVEVQSPVTEAGVSANAYFVSPKGGNWQITLRSNADEVALYNVFNLIATLEDVLGEDGWTFKQVGAAAVSAGPAGVDLPTPGAPRPVAGPTGAVPPPTPEAGVGHGRHTDTTFPALSLKCKDGEYWTITSAKKFPLYPIAVSEAVLQAAGIPVGSLDPTVIYNIAGYIATFTRNDKGNPNAVVRLDKS